jgi:Mrp family chromosome partitioning ATPase
LSSVYDALQRARRGGQNGSPPASEPTLHEPARDSTQLPANLPPRPMAAELSSLLAAVRPLLDHDSGVVLQIVAATPGEGASTIAREFAMLAGTSGHRRTLLIDADRRDPQTARAFGYDSKQGLIDLLWSGNEGDDVLQPIAGTLLSVTRLIGERGPAAADADSLRELYGRLREQFELVIVDCPPVGGGAYSNLLPEAVDGVVLVVQAEKTRPAVIAHARDMVQQAGGQVLGAVLNRRTNYIPEFLYKLL